MTTRAQMRTTIRNELNDAGGTPLWPDAQLNEWLVEGLRDLGRQLGLEKSQSITSVANQGSYALAADVVQVARVEHPAGYFRVPRGFASGDVSPDAILDLDPRVKPLELLYDVFGGSLVLSPAPSASGESIVVRYQGAYAEPSADSSVLDLPSRDEDALLFYVCGRAMQWIGADEAKRQRFERQRGADPGSLRREYDRDYRAVIRERRGRVATRRLVVR
ncbi:MAG TPA: hypothetical protein VEQ11_15030 [Chloroflexota bacterium]|nr:hypothetical protein [Chloroflexota bacterium]